MISGAYPRTLNVWNLAGIETDGFPIRRFFVIFLEIKLRFKMIEKKHGGYRPGAGRKKKDRTLQGKFENALDYLTAVTQGAVEPDALRISAAKAVLPYEEPKKRLKVKSDRPEVIRAKETRAIEEDNLLIFEEKASKIREKYKRLEGRK
jgi:hypothetical protein